MEATIRTTRKLLFAASVCMALAFGTSQALADTRVRACGYPSIGACGSHGQCFRMCGEAGGEVVDAECVGGCCYCEFGILG